MYEGLPTVENHRFLSLPAILSTIMVTIIFVGGLLIYQSQTGKIRIAPAAQIDERSGNKRILSPSPRRIENPLRFQRIF